MKLNENTEFVFGHHLYLMLGKQPIIIKDGTGKRGYLLAEISSPYDDLGKVIGFIEARDTDEAIAKWSGFQQYDDEELKEFLKSEHFKEKFREFVKSYVLMPVEPLKYEVKEDEWDGD